MISRYSLMNEGAVSDDNDKQVYPDPLSFDFGSFSYTEPPYVVEPSDQMYNRPYLITYALYNKSEYDDIIFNINNVPHISKIFDYESFKYPTSSDLVEFLKKVV